MEAAAAGRGWEGVADHLSSFVQRQEELRAQHRKVEEEVLQAARKVSSRLHARTEQLFSEDNSTSGEAAAADQGSKSPEPDVSSLKELSILLQANLHSIIAAREQAELRNCYERLCERAYAPELMERSLKTEGEIDKRIEKKMVHLVRLKEYKRLYTPKQVSEQQKDLPATKGQSLELESSKGSSSSSTGAESPTLAPK